MCSVLNVVTHNVESDGFFHFLNRYTVCHKKSTPVFVAPHSCIFKNMSFGSTSVGVEQRQRVDCIID